MNFYERVIQRANAVPQLDDGQQFMFHVLHERHRNNPQVIAAGPPEHMMPAQMARLYALFMEIERNEAIEEMHKAQQQVAAMRAQLEVLQPIRAILDQNARLQQELVALGKEHIRAQQTERQCAQQLETSLAALRTHYDQRLQRARQRLTAAHLKHLDEVAAVVTDANLRDLWVAHMDQVRLILEE